MPVTIAAINRAIGNQRNEIGRDGKRIVWGACGALLVGLPIVATCVTVGLLKNKDWKRATQILVNGQPTSSTFHGGYFLAIVGSLVGGFFGGVGGGCAAERFYYWRQQRRLADLSEAQESLPALARIAPRLSDENLRPLISGCNYSELIALEGPLGTERLTDLVANSTLPARTRWAWGLTHHVRQQDTVSGLQEALQDRLQLADAATQVPGFLPHLTQVALEREERLRVSDEDVLAVRQLLGAVATRYYNPEPGMSTVTIDLGEGELLTVDAEALSHHSDFLHTQAHFLEENDLTLDFGDEPASLKKGLSALLAILQGECFIEELTRDELLSQCYPAADKYGFNRLLVALERVILDRLDSGALSPDFRTLG